MDYLLCIVKGTAAINSPTAFSSYLTAYNIFVLISLLFQLFHLLTLHCF